MGRKEKKFLYCVGFLMILLFVLALIALPIAYYWTQTRGINYKSLNESNATSQAPDASKFRKGNGTIDVGPYYKTGIVLKAATPLTCSAPPVAESFENFAPVREWNGNVNEGTIVTYYCYPESTFVYQKLACVNKQWTFILRPNVKANCECVDPPVSAPDFPRAWSGNAKIGDEVKYFCGSTGRLRLKMKCNEERSWEITVRQECECQKKLEPPFLSQNDIDLFETVNDASHVFIMCNLLPKSTNFFVFNCADMEPEYVPFEEIGMDWAEIKNVNDRQNYLCACSNAPKYRRNYLHSFVFYYCLDRPDEPYVKLAICSSDKQWMATEKDSMGLIEKINKYCGIKRCPELPLPELPLGIIWDTSADPSFPGSVNKYACTLNATTQIYQTATCDKNGEWIVKKLSRVCECISDPPAAHRNLVRLWKQKSHNLGTVVRYRCPGDSKNTAISYTYTCSAPALKWIYTKLEDCGCGEAPPKAPKPIVREWSTSHRYGTKVRYYCFEGWKTSTMQSGECKEDGNWYMEYGGTWDDLYHKKCICWDNPPLASFPNIRKWNEGSRRIGTRVSYLCFNHPKSSVKHLFECGANGKWVKIVIKDCVCTVPPPEPPEGIVQVWNKRFTVGTVAVYRCKNAPARSPPIQTATCSETHGVWMMMKQISFNKLLQGHCICEDEPPTPDKYLIRIWKNSPKGLGSVAEYKCPNEKISYRYVCSPNKKWKKQQVVKCDLSGCREPPPASPEQVYYKWPNHDLKIGTQVDYFCKDVSESIEKPVQSVICMNNHKWKLQNDSSWITVIEDKCDCILDPPLVNGLFRVWDRKSHVGSVSKYACPNGFILYEYICNGNREWVKKRIPAKCHHSACIELSPLIEGLVSKWHEDKKSSIVTMTYHCKGARSLGVAVQTAKCNNVDGKWSMQKKQSWMQLIKDNCYCLADPPVPKENLKQIWKDKRKLLGDIVEYICPTGILRFQFICSAEKKWVKKEISQCNPSQCTIDPPLPIKGTTMKWHPETPNTVNYYCEHDSNSTEIIQSATCNRVNNKWSFEKAESLLKIYKDDCSCQSSPPKPELHLKLVWDAKDTEAGAVAKYHCPNDSLSYKYICEGHNKWTKVKISDCSCIVDPPEAILPTVRSWNGISRKMGSVVKYNCLQDARFGVKYLYKCGLDQTWTKIDISSCMCDDTPPTFEDRKPNYVSKYVGAAVYYQCSNDGEHGYSAIYRCGSERKWVLEESFSCYCTGKPPSPGPGIVDDSSKLQGNEGVFVGARVLYRCEGQSMAPPIQTAVCIRLPNSQQKGWLLSSPLSWETLTKDYCVCKSAPPAAGPHMDWRWNNNSSPKVVQYFCNNRSRKVVGTASCENESWLLDTNGSSWKTILQEECSKKPKCGVKFEDQVVCIRTHDELQSHTEASMNCLMKKSQLLQVLNKNILEQLQQCAIDSICNDYYISLTYNTKDSQWYHETNEKVSNYTNWDETAIQNPELNDERQCVVVDTVSGKWKTVNCIERHCFACQVLVNSTDVGSCRKIEED